MAKPKIENLWLAEREGEKFIRVAWSNGRHHEVAIRFCGDVDDVVNALSDTIHLLLRDHNLRLEPKD